MEKREDGGVGLEEVVRGAEKEVVVLDKASVRSCRRSALVDYSRKLVIE